MSNAQCCSVCLDNTAIFVQCKWFCNTIQLWCVLELFCYGLLSNKCVYVVKYILNWLYIHIYRTSFHHLAPGTSSHHLPPGKGCLKVRCPCLSNRYWSYSLHAQISSAVSYALFLLYRLHGVWSLATQTHQLLEVLHPGVLPRLQLHVVTKLR